MGMTYSTAQVGTHRQFQYFRDTICEAVIHLGARRLRPGAFGADGRLSAQGALVLARLVHEDLRRARI